jgi:hypothetical protein
MSRPLKEDHLLVRRRPKTRQRKTPAATHEIDPLESLALMNAESVPPKQRYAIARKILPYFHQKPKPIRAEDFYDSLVENHPTEDEDEDEDPGLASDERERLRKMIFGRFD